MKRHWWKTWRPGIRAQLAVLYTTVFAVLFLVIGGAYYAYLQSSLQQSFITTLRTRTQLIASGVSLENGVVCIQDVAGVLPGLNTVAPCGNQDTSASSAPEAPTASTDSRPANVKYGDLVRILDRSGKVVYTSHAFHAIDPPRSSVQQPLHDGSTWSGAVMAHNGVEVQLYSAPLVDNNGLVYGVVQVGEPLASLVQTLHDIVLTLALIAPFALMLSAVGSYWLAGRAFRPIVRLTRTARDIEANDLHQRVPVPTASDEVRDLAVTLNAMIARLEQAFAQQRRFVADASHELRTPVASIRTMTDVVLAQTDATREELTTTLLNVNVEAERLGGLISELLVLARVDEGEGRLELEPVQLDLVAAMSAAVAAPLASSRGITVEVLAPEQIVVIGDETRLTQMTMNLIDNAIRYTDSGGHVTVCTSQCGSMAQFSVTDTGVGIAAEHLPHIFERFYRADPAHSRTDRNSGSGLGLSIVEWVVRAHGGTVAVESDVGHGSSFTVSLPLAPPHIPPCQKEMDLKRRIF